MRRKSVDEMLLEAGLDSGAFASDLGTTNKLLALLLAKFDESSRSQRILAATSDVGINWDTFEKYVIPGTVPTQLVQVQKGDVVVVKLTNNDVDGAQIVYYSKDPRLTPPDFRGMKYNFKTTSTLYFDFDIGGGELNAALPAGDYDGDTVATAMQALIDALTAPGFLTFEYNAATKKFDVYITGGVGTLSILCQSGTHGSGGLGDNIYDDIGFDDSADKTAAVTYSGDGVRFNEYAIEKDALDRGYPLVAGDSCTLVLDGESLYAVSEAGYDQNILVQVRRSRIARGHQ